MPECTRWEEVERHVDWGYYSQSSDEEGLRESHDWDEESEWSRRGSLESVSDECPSPSLSPTFYLKNYDWSRTDRGDDGEWEETKVEYWENIEFLWLKDGLVTSKVVSRSCFDFVDGFD